MKYIIIKSIDLKVLDISEFVGVLMYNVDKSLCILSYKGDKPKSLSKVNIEPFEGRVVHTHTELIELKKIVSSKESYGWVRIEK